MSDQPKKWFEMTDAEKGALLLAHHEGRTIEFLCFEEWSNTNRPKWQSCSAYRIKPDPVVETHIIPIAANGYVYDPTRHTGDPIYEITYRKIDGKPDFSSIKMEARR